jgi:hypothetical protein
VALGAEEGAGLADATEEYTAVLDDELALTDAELSGEVLSDSDAADLLTDSGLDESRADAYVKSCEGDIKLVDVQPGEQLGRYTQDQLSSGRFLTDSEFANPSDAIEGLNTYPKGSYQGNMCTFRQTVTAQVPTQVLRSLISGGGPGVYQYIILNPAAWDFVAGVIY